MNIFGIFGMCAICVGFGGLGLALFTEMICMLGLSIGLWDVLSPVVDNFMYTAMFFMSGGLCIAFVLAILAVVIG
jgi:hypothetical protein